MTESQVIPIQDSFDIIEARVHVRTLARDLGFDLFDQARISLAASTLAYILGLGREVEGQILLERCQDDRRHGVRVVCLRFRPMRHEIPAGVLDDARRMVDDLQVELLPSGAMSIVLIKWAGRPAADLDPAPDALPPAWHSPQ